MIYLETWTKRSELLASTCRINGDYRITHVLGDAAYDCLADMYTSPWREYEAILGHRN